MSSLWPRLSRSEATEIFTSVKHGSIPAASASHEAQSFAEAGVRVSEGEIRTMSEEIRDLAVKAGFGRDGVPTDKALQRFDTSVMPVLGKAMDLSWSEASAGEVWSFVALVVLPDVTAWRWAGSLNRDRWIGMDLTRHQWARLWWRYTAFQGHVDALTRLNESEIDQLMARRTIGGTPTYVTALAEAFLKTIDEVEARGGTVPRRSLLRDLAKRARRSQAFVDVVSLDEENVSRMASGMACEALEALIGETGGAR